MNVRPHEAKGIIRKTGHKWSIELPHEIVGVDDGTPIRIVFWDDRPSGDKSDIEEIARVQQIDIEVAAKGLTSEGALEKEKEEFLERLKDTGV